MAYLGVFFSVVSDGVEPSFLGCEPSVFAVGPRDGLSSLEHAPKDLNPDRLGWSQSCCHYTRGVCLKRKLRELESNQRPPATTASRRCPEPGVTANSNCPAVLVKPRQRLLSEVRSFEFSVRELHPICELQRLTSRLRAGESALRESNPPRQLGRLVPLPIGQGH